MIIAQLIATVFGRIAASNPQITTTILTVLDAYKINSVLFLTAESGGTGSFIDSSSNNLTVTANGTPGQGVVSPYYAPGYYSNYFNGSSYLRAPNNTAFNFGTGDFTIEFWLNATVWSGGPGIVGQKGDDNSPGWVIYKNSGSNFMNVRLSGTTDRPSTKSPIVGQWQHWALVRSGTTLTWYCDGQSSGVHTSVSTNVLDTAAPLYIGFAQTWSTYFNGYISNLRIVKGTAVYTTNFIPSTTPLTAIPNTVLLTCQSNRFIDNSVQSSTLTVTGSPRTSSFGPFAEIKSITDPTVSGLKSVYFSGSADYLTVSGTSSFNFGTSNFTLECWVLQPNITAGTRIISALTPYSTGNTGWALYFNAGSLAWFVNGANRIVSATPVVATTWNHLAIVRNNGSTVMYLNGVATGSVYTDSTNYSGSAQYVGSDLSQHYLGHISNLRVVKGTAVYTGNFIPPTTELTAINGTSLLALTGANPMLDSSTNLLTITPSGAPQIKNFSPFDATPGANIVANTYNSTYFDATGSRLTATSSGFAFGTGPFCIEAWVYNNVLKDFSMICTTRPDNGAYSDAFHLGYNGVGGISLYIGTTGYAGGPSGSVKANIWQHIAYSRDSNNLVSIFVDGVRVGSQTVNINLTRTLLGIGDFPTTPAEGINGYISNLRIVKGSSVYNPTATTITVPTAPLTAIVNTSLLTLSGNNQISDLSSNALLIVMTGSPRAQLQSPFTALPAYSTYFYATRYLTIPYNASMVQWWDTDYTVEMWVYNLVNANSGGANALPLQFAYGDPNGAVTYWTFGTNLNGNLLFYYYNGGGVYSAVSTSTVPLNSWNHIAMVYTNSNSTIKGYVNGTQVFSVAKAGTPQAPAGLTINIGRVQGVNYAGYISNLRIVRGTNTAVYTSAFTPSTIPLTAIANTSLLALVGSNQFNDISSNRYTISRFGGVGTSEKSPFATTAITPAAGYYGSVSFNGSTDYIKYTIPTLPSAATPFTMEAWVYFNSFNGVVIASSEYPVTGTPMPFVMGMSTDMNFNNSNTPTFGYFDGANWQSFIISPVGLNTFTWYHLAYVYTGTRSHIYINGVSVVSTATTSWTTHANTSFLVGRRWDTSRNVYFNGYISNFRLVIGTAVYTANFTPSTIPLTAISDTALLTCSTAPNVDSSAILNQTTNPVASTIFGTPKFSIFDPFITSTPLALGAYGGSMYFNGSSDYLSVPGSTAFNFGNGDFTIEAWIYWITGAGEQALFCVDVSGGFNLSFNFSGNWGIGGRATTIHNTFGTPPTKNTWNHIAVSRSSSTIRAFINGNQTFSGSNSQNYPGGTAAGIAAIPTSTGNIWGGYISNLRIVKGTAVYTNNFIPSTTPVTAITNTQLLLNANNTELIDSTGNNDIIPNSPTTSMLSTAQVKFGSKSIYFNGSTTFLKVPSNPALALGAGDFTVEFWMYPVLSYSGAYSGIMDSRTSGDGAGVVYLGYTTTANQIGWSDNASFRVTASVTQNAWQHVAFVRSGTTLSVYINGTSVSSATYSQSLTVPFTFIGSSFNSYRFNGYLDDIRITPGIARYTSNFTPVNITTNIDDIYLSSTQLYLRGDAGVLTNTVTDSSANNFAVTKYGAPGQGTFTPSAVGYYSTLFGASDYFQVPTTSALQFGTSNFTIECWVYLNSNINPTRNRLIWYNYVTSFTTDSVLFGCHGSFGSKVTFWAFNANSGSAPLLTDPTTLTPFVWTHLAVVRNGINFTLYRNGISVSTATSSASIVGPTWTTGGFISSSGTSGLDGYMSNLRIVNGTAVYTEAFTPSTTPLTAVSGTSLLACYDGTMMFGTTSTAMLTPFGTPRTTSWSPFVKAFDTTMAGSYFFNTGSYLSVNAQTALSFGTGDFTIECWVYPTALNSNFSTVIEARGGVVATPWVYGLRPVGGVLKSELYLGTAYRSATTIQLNAWTHIAYTRNTGVLSVFVNGVLDTSWSGISGAVNAGGVTQYIGTAFDGAVTIMLGYISNLRVVKGTAQYSTVPLNVPSAELTLVGDIYSANTTLLLNGNLQTTTVLGDTIVDNSTNALAITRNGTPTINASSPFTNAGISGNSIYFNGSSSYLTVPTSSALQFGTGNFTIECWVYLNTKITAFPTVFANYNSWGAGAFVLFAGHNGAPNDYVLAVNGVFPSITTPIIYNSWNHLAVVRNGNIFTFYIDGTSRGTYSAANGTPVDNVGTNWFIGTAGDNPANASLNGYISNFRMVKGAALYNGTFVPSTTPLTAVTNTSFLLSTQTLQNNTFVDSSSNALTITRNGSSSQNAFSPFTNAGNSVYFNGSTDSLTIGHNNVLELGAGNFTIEFWVYAISGNTLYCWSSDQHYAMSWNYGGAGGNRIGIWASSNGSSWNIFNADGGGNGISTGTLSPNTWTHIALVRNGSAWTLYLNGTSAWTGSSSATIVTRSTDTFRIPGPWPAGGPVLFSGYISNFRIVKGAALYTGTFVPSTTPLTTTSQNATTATTSLLLNFSNLGVIDNSSFRNGVSTIGDAKISTAVKRFGTGSLYFDGTGDSLYIPWSANLELGSDDFTIEFWVYAISGNTLYCWSSDQHYAMSWNYAGANANRIGIWASTTGSSWNIFNADGGGNGISTGTLSPNTWTHVALVRNGSAWTLYLNGTSAWTGSSSATIVTRNTDTFRIAGPWPAGGPSSFNGYLDDFRITKGVARFASTLKNFIPSTAVLTQTSQGATAATTSLLLTAQNSNLIDNTFKNNFTIVGNVTSRTSIVKAGATSMYFDGSSYAFANGQPNHFSSGDFTVELWVYLTTVTSSRVIIDYRPAGSQGAYFTLWINTQSQFTYYVNSAVQITGAVAQAGTWYHVAVVRLVGNTKMYINGTQMGSTYTDNNVYLSAVNRPTVGGDGFTPGSVITDCYIDDFRVSNVARYTTNFYTGPYTASALQSTVSVASVSSAYLKVGIPVTFTITTTNLPNGTILNWTNTGTSIGSYFADGVNSGMVIISNNTATVTRPLLASDSASASTLILSISNLSGTVLATSSEVSLSTAPASVSATYLIVAGGGGGGNGTNQADNGGGGGAGGLLTGTVSLSSATTYTITIGSGGPATTNGTNSVLSGAGIATQTSVGGGRGGSGSGSTASSGGSGGGGHGLGGAAGSGTTAQGNAGGSGSGSWSAGGGGAGAIGGNGGSSIGAGAGGVGLASSISGTSTFYAGGGGGSGSGTTYPNGGNGGGGTGNLSGAAGGRGTANTGGGGGGGSGSGGSGVGGNGGSGIAIVSYAGAQLFAGGTVAFVGGNTIHTFTTSGSLA